MVRELTIVKGKWRKAPEVSDIDFADVMIDVVYKHPYKTCSYLGGVKNYRKYFPKNRPMEISEEELKKLETEGAAGDLKEKRE